MPSQTLSAPSAARQPQEFEHHGKTHSDAYYWLREKESPEVIAYLEAENAYTDSVMAHTETLQETLYKEIRARIKEEDDSVPEKRGDYYYYSRTEDNKQYRIHCRKQGDMDADEEILLDQNELAEGEGYFRVGVFCVSPDHSLLAYSTDTSGSEQYVIHFKNLETGELLTDEIPKTDYSAAWANDSKTLFYTVLDHARRPYRLYRHVLGAPVDSDVLVIDEPDERFYMVCRKSKSQRYIFTYASGKVTSVAWYTDADNPTSATQIIEPHTEGLRYSVEHHSRAADETPNGQTVDRFLIVTNDNAINSRVMEAPVSAPGKENWQEWIPHRDDVKITGVEAFRDYIIVYQRSEGLRKIWVHDVDKNEGHEIDFPEPVYTSHGGSNPTYDSHILRMGYTSLTTPASMFDYDMADRSRVLLKQQPVLGGYNSEDYVSERLWATATDGTKIPISLVRHKDTSLDEPAPTLLYGYGSYEVSLDPYFSMSRISLLDRGMIYAEAQVRGGGEMGRMWYENGKFLHKKNTFTDFINCAEHLIAEGYTRPELLAAEGRSAGGLLMGGITNLRPDLFRAIVAGVPFMDVINTMMDPSIPLTVMEYDEWGNPNDPVFYEYMKSYAPYENLAAKDYPNILVTAGLNDPRVAFWEPAKYVAKLRTLKTDSNRLILKTNMGAGHGGASGRFDYLKEIAFDYAFVLDVLGVGE